MSDKKPKNAAAIEKTAASEDGRDSFVTSSKPGETDAQAIARVSLDPCVGAALSLKFWACTPREHNNVTQLMGELDRQAKKANGNDLAQLESMLVAQAHTLDAVFQRCLRQAAANMSEYPEAFERFMRMAYKAQSQSRASIESLAEMKNPKPFIAVGQANVSAGHQQVNNGTAPVARENRNRSNELLEHRNGKRLDASSKSPAILGNTAMETMGAVNGAKIRRRKDSR